MHLQNEFLTSHATADGANVAYYMQNFDKGKFNYHQLRFMVDAVENKKEKPLVILPAKYGRREFFVPQGSGFGKQVLNEKEMKILEECVLYAAFWCF